MNPAHLVNREIQVLRDFRVHKVQLARQGKKAPWGSLACRGCQEPMALRVTRAKKAPLGRREARVQLGLRVPLDTPGPVV